jgi:hypothetical protein
MNTNINILKKAHCGKVSTPEKESLTYNIGNNGGDEYYFRITDNIGGGYFSKEWVNLNDITQHLPTDSNFNAAVLAPLFKSKSANNAGFLAAALKAESLLIPVKETKRLHSLGDLVAFNKAMQKLVKSKISLPDEIAKREAEKEAKRIALAEQFKAKLKAAETTTKA